MQTSPPHQATATFWGQCPVKKGSGAKVNYVDLPDLHSLDLFKGQLVPRSIINPGGRRTRVSGDPLSDLDCAARIHVFGNARRTEAVTTNSFQDPACPRPFLNQLQHTPTIQASEFEKTLLFLGDFDGEFSSWPIWLGCSAPSACSRIASARP
jgi:hypothetical protein